MSAINRDNRQEKIAKVLIFTTEGTSKIEVLHGSTKEIRVYISVNSALSPVQSYRQSLLQLFLYLIDGHRIPSVEYSSDVSQDIIKLFVNICTQVDSGKPINSIVDDNRRLIISESTRVTVVANENRLIAETDERLPVQRTERYENDLPRRLRQNEQFETQLPERQQNQRRQQQETVRRGINELFGLLGTDGTHEEQVGQVLTEVGQILSGNARSNLQSNLQPNLQPNPSSNTTPTDHVRATVERRRQSSILPTPIFPAVEALPFPLNIFAMGNNRSAQHRQTEDSPLLEPLVRNLNDPQPNISNQQIRPIQRVGQQDESNESSIPSRFVENHSGARREIFPDEKNIITPEVSPISNQPTESVAHPTHIAPVRNPVSMELIHKIASNVSELIKSGKTRPPDFKLKTKSGMTRIKNYIHNVARVWLSQNEIELFLSELTKLQSAT